jgi:hypothetical protein
MIGLKNRHFADLVNSRTDENHGVFARGLRSLAQPNVGKVEGDGDSKIDGGLVLRAVHFRGRLVQTEADDVDRGRRAE